MMKTDSKQGGKVGQRAKHLAVLAFFLHALPALAASNTVTGTVYGDAAAIANAVSISSIADGTTDLRIQYADTTNLVLNNKINGTIFVDSGFSNLTITATNSTLSSWKENAVLSVNGGTNLTIIGGNFIGLKGTNTFTFPPIPGQGTQQYYATNASIGGLIINVQTSTLSNTHFEGATYAPNPTFLLGTDALKINNSTNLDITGTISEFIGGNGGDIYSSSNNTYTVGGCGLSLADSSVTISNGTVQGGSTGDAVAGDGYTSHSIGGHGIYTTNSTLKIHDGRFTGGDAGSATTTQAGIGVFSNDSDVTIEAGTFTGGSYGSETNFGLFSQVSSGKTTHITLNGGTFNLLGFGGEGTLSLTTGTNGLLVSEGIFQYDGTVIVNNLSNTAFQTNTVNKGTMRFLNDFVLSDKGIFHVASHESFIDFTTNLTISSGATVWFTSTTNGTGVITAKKIFFETNSTLSIANNIIGLQAGNDIINSVIEASDGIYVDTTLATSENFTNDVNIVGLTQTRSGLAEILLNGNTKLSLRFVTKPLTEYWNATGEFARLANELDRMTNQNSVLLANIDILDLNAGYTVSGSATEETYFTTMNTFQTAMQGMQAAVGQSVSRGAEFREQLKLAPPGAKGPERKNDLRGWGKYYGQFYTHDAKGLNPEYDATLHGGVIGVDKSLGNLLVGISGGSGRYSATSGIDGEENTTAYHGALYATYGTDHAYFDTGIAYGFNQVETRTTRPFVLDGEFDAQIISGYFGGGYDLVNTKGGTVFTPEASIQYSTYKQDAYSETSTTAVPRNIDAFDADSLRSSLGINLSMLNTTAFETFGFKLDGRAHWLHEFNPEPGSLGFSLEGGGNDYQLAHPLLDEELFRVGIGCSFFNTLHNQPKNVLLRFDFDELFGDGFNSHNLSAKLIYAF